MQDALDLTVRRNRATATALLEEVRRLGAELGPTPTENLIIPVGDYAIPHVHPWMHPLIPEIALTDAAIVGMFLTLDRELDNHRVAVRQVQDARQALAAKKQELATLEQLYENTQVDVTKEISSWGELTRDINLCDQSVSTALDFAGGTYKQCHGTLGRLADALTRGSIQRTPASTMVVK